MFIMLMLLPGGCQKHQTSGLGSASDYGYAIDTPESREAVQRRFEAALRLLDDAGLQTKQAHNDNERREVTFADKNISGTLTLVLPGTGLANISLTYRFAANDDTVKKRADQLLSRLQQVLAPANPAPDKAAK